MDMKKLFELAGVDATKGKAKKLVESSDMVGKTMSLEGDFTVSGSRPTISTMLVQVVQMPAGAATGGARPSPDHYFVKVVKVGPAASRVVKVGQLAHMYFDGNSATVNNYDPDDGFYVPNEDQTDVEWSLTDPDIYRSDE